MHGILIFAHGARDPQWATPFIEIRDQLRVQCPTTRIELAYLELMTPSLMDAAREMVESGVDTLTVVPLFMARGAHLKEDLPRLIESFAAAHPDVRIQLTPAIGEVPELIHAMCTWIRKVSAL